MKLRAAVVALLVASACKSAPKDDGPREVLTYSVDAKDGAPQTAEAIKRRFSALGVQATVEAKDGLVVIELSKQRANEDAVRAAMELRGAFALKVVDEGSEYMQGLFRHVGALRSGEATDPRAVTDEVHADVDQWRGQDGVAHVDYYLVASNRDRESGKTVIEKYLADLRAAEPTFALPAGREIGYALMSPDPQARDQRPHWRTYYLDPTPRLTNADVAKATAETDSVSTFPIVSIELTPAGSTAFTKLTTDIVGKKLAIMIDGDVQSAPLIMEPIHGGRLGMSLAGEQAERASYEVATALSSGPLGGRVRLETITRRP